MHRRCTADTSNFRINKSFAFCHDDQCRLIDIIVKMGFVFFALLFYFKIVYLCLPEMSSIELFLLITVLFCWSQNIQCWNEIMVNL